MIVDKSSRKLTYYPQASTYLAVTLGLGITLCGGTAAHAQSLQDWFSQKTMTGDWNGARPKLADLGITFKAGYVGEFADDVSGGKRQGNGIASQVFGNAIVDLGKLAGLQGGTLNIGFNQRVGRNATSDFVGNKLAVQEVYGAGETLRLTEISYEQLFARSGVDTKIGFYPMGNDFASTPLGCDYQNVGFCAHPQNLPGGSAGWADNPQGRLGGRIRFFATPDLYAETGVYDANPTFTARGNGLKVGTSGSTGATFPAEIGYTLLPGSLPGHYKIGGYYDSSDAADVTNAKEIDKGRYGAYALVDQMLIAFDDTGKRGVIALAQVSYSDPRTALLQGTLLGGLIAQGIMASRPVDYLDIGYVRAVINQRAVLLKEAKSDGTLSDLSEGEGVLEAGYGLQALPWLQVHPNVQYVMNPGTFSYKKNIPNAWVFGVQTKILF